ncbi:MAG: 50S ribosomal protein L22 [Deltaproteobacteria bacterium]|nr:50S ribosomal protein L22 [Deltaproteobacteria bacterium]
MADQVRASARFVRQAPYKVRQVVDLVRGMGVGEAQRLLAFSRRSAAKTISKLLKSAVANAEETGKLDVDSLFVARMWVDEGPTWKRWTPRAMGRGTPIRKRTSHVTVELAER